MADTKEFFNDTLPKKLEGNPDLAKDINAVFQFDIDGAGTWTVDLSDGAGSVSEGAADDPGCVVEVAESDFEGLLENPASGMQLFITGKLKVTNPGLALSLQKILE